MNFINDFIHMITDSSLWHWDMIPDGYCFSNAHVNCI